MKTKPLRRCNPASALSDPGRLLGVGLALAFWLLVAAVGQAPCEQSTPATEAASTKVLDLSTSMADALKTAEARRDRLKAEWEGAQRENRSLAGELAAYRIQLSTFGNLAGLPSVDPEILAKALAEQRRSQAAVQDTLDRLAPRRQALVELRGQTEQQLALNRTQFEEIKKAPPPAAGQTRWLDQLAAVIRVQKEIIGLIAKLDPLYADQVSNLTTMAGNLAGLGQTLAAARDEARRTAVLTRAASPLAKLNRTGLAEESSRLVRFGRSLTDRQFWRFQTEAFLRTGPGPMLAIFVLGCGLLLLLLRLRVALGRLIRRTDNAQLPWRAALLNMFQRTVVPLGLLVFMAANMGPGLEPGATTLPGALVTFFVVWLAGYWVRQFFALAPLGPSHPQWPLLAITARRLVRLSRLYAAVHIFLTWSLGGGGMLEALARLVLEIVLAAVLVGFWRTWRPRQTPRESVQAKSWTQQAAVVASYTIALAGPAFDLAGYAALALFWYLGWGLTLVTVLWSALLGQTLREMDRPAVAGATTGTTTPAREPLHWALLRVAWLAWALLFLAALALAWGGWESLSSGLGRILSHPFVIGDTTFRLNGLLIGVLVLFFTHLATRLWRQLLLGQVLSGSGITHGARDSIVTISVYAIWAAGILVALRAFGISTTSLTVAFGALGIGLGFGLQNIFNNFISGLILLFERPIQVGDDIEINGIWARVMQINVRATLVQTYDGAALIIPNSEFISNAVTNWSHRDPYLRRSINVGVAYGSDTVLVRQTLLEAAANTAEVLPNPQPDILFTDFGESTLDFRLRVWTTVDNMLRADTALRFEIDRLFRLKGIEIAFPQRDLHLRSLPPEMKLEKPCALKQPADRPETDDAI